MTEEAKEMGWRTSVQDNTNIHLKCEELNFFTSKFFTFDDNSKQCHFDSSFKKIFRKPFNFCRNFKRTVSVDECVLFKI